MPKKLHFLFMVLFFKSLVLSAGNELIALDFIKEKDQISYVFPASHLNESAVPYQYLQNNNQQLPASAVTLSPNPTKNKRFTITLNNLKGESRVAIYNIIGVLVKKTKMTSNKMTVDLNDFSTGIYLVNVSNNRRNLVKKIVVK